MTTKPNQTTFVVWAPDCTDSGALERRLAVRATHLQNAQQLTKEGTLRIGGGVLTAESAVAAPGDRKFFGSCVIFEAESIDAVRKLVEEDVYYKNGVWDKEKLQILPILMATSLPPVPS